MQRLFLWIVIGITLITVSGCVGYYAQSIHGQFAIMIRSKPIDDVINDPATGTAIQEKLRRVAEIRSFAVESLALPNNESYTEYADLGRDYVVWNVFATPELSLTPMEWCFPVAGCVNYRGYFKRKAAESFANGLADKGHDVYLAGVPAYSTLGWFRDPLLNTVMQYRIEDIAGLIFHELAHQLVYAKNDTMFNESFATVVEREGVRRWLTANGDLDRLQRYETRKARNLEVIKLVQQYRERLVEVYAAEQTHSWKRGRKHELLNELKRSYLELVRQWKGYTEFDRWFDGPLNNAQLASLSIYYQFVPAFESLIAEHSGDLPKFYAAVKELARLSPPERLARLRALVRSTPS